MAGKFAKLGAAAALLLACIAGGAADDYESLFQQAAELSQLGKYGEAIERYKAALALRPGAPEALSNLAVMYYAGEKYREAWKAAEQALKARPGMTPAALIAGLSAIRCDRPADAVIPLEQEIGRASCRERV